MTLARRRLGFRSALGLLAALLAFAGAAAAPMAALAHVTAEVSSPEDGFHAACPAPSPHGAGCAVCRGLARPSAALAAAGASAVQAEVSSPLRAPALRASRDQFSCCLASPRAPPSLS
ncbi:MAG TPA: hypothetical protein VIE39_00690 [Thermoanaerobaculia bacterium]